MVYKYADLTSAVARVARSPKLIPNQIFWLYRILRNTSINKEQLNVMSIKLTMIVVTIAPEYELNNNLYRCHYLNFTDIHTKSTIKTHSALILAAMSLLNGSTASASSFQVGGGST